MSELSAIIVNYNAGSALTETVLALLKSLFVTKIIVVDNGSTDNSLEEMRRITVSPPGLICIRNHANLGFARACNIGIAASGQSKYLLFLNPDCLADKESLGKLLSCLETSPQSGMAGPLLLNPDGTEQAGGRRDIPTPGRSFVRAFGLSGLNKLFPGIFSDFLLHEQPLPEGYGEVDAISGSCMLARREALEDVGPFDEGYFLHCEDLDWCMRFRQKGWKIMFVPDARVIHHKGVCSKARPFFVEWNKHKGMIRFYKKFFRQQYPFFLFWVIVAGVLLRFAAVTFYYGAASLTRRFKRNAL